MSDALGPTITFDVADDGWKGEQQDGIYLALTRQIGDSTGTLTVSLFDGQVATDPCVPVAEGTVARTAEGFTEWLAASPVLSTTTTPATLAGEPVTQVDATVLGFACPNSPWMTFWNGFLLYPSEAGRFLALDHGDQVIIVSAEAVQSTDLRDFLDAAQPVIDSLTITGTGPVTPPASPSASIPASKSRSRLPCPGDLEAPLRDRLPRFSWHPQEDGRDLHPASIREP